MSYGRSSGTETVREQCYDLEDLLSGTPEDHIKNPIYQRLTEIMHKEAKGDISTLCNRGITLVIKYVEYVNEVLKCIPVRNSFVLKLVARASALLVCENVGVKTDHTIKGTILEGENRKGYCNFEEGFK